MALKDLGEKLYEGRFSYIVTHENDGNGHLNNPDYFHYSERARRDFLAEFGLSDILLRENHGVKLIVRRRKDVAYKLPIFHGDKIDVQLKVSLRETPFLGMDYIFYKSDERAAFIDRTMNIFEDDKTKKSIPVPAFFIDALKTRMAGRTLST